MQAGPGPAGTSTRAGAAFTDPVGDTDMPGAALGCTENLRKMEMLTFYCFNWKTVSLGVGTR